MIKSIPSSPGRNYGILRLFPVIGLWGATAAACLLSPPPEAGESSGVRLHFPDQLGDYQGESLEPVDGELRLLPEDTEFAKALYYPTPGNDPWEAAYCSIIRTGNDRRSIHRPEICMEGQGWSIRGSRRASVSLGDEKTLAVTVLSLTKFEEQAEGDPIELNARYVYWFVGKDITTPSNNGRLFLTVSDNLLRNINHRWSYVSVMAYATDVFDRDARSPEETEQFIFEIIRHLFPVIQPSFSADEPDLP